MMKKRLDFAKRHAKWSPDQWRHVCFSDESTFQCQDAHQSRVWQLPNAPAPVQPTVKHPTKIMVWGMISYNNCSDLHICNGIMNAQKYIEQLQQSMTPKLESWFPARDGIFMQDGAPCHTAKACKAYLEQAGIVTLEWPGNSPDLNPIENIWGLVKRQLATMTITNKQQLHQELQKFWCQDSKIQQHIRKSIDSMPRRIEAVIKAKGGHTKY
jgi:transposase